MKFLGRAAAVLCAALALSAVGCKKEDTSADEASSAAQSASAAHGDEDIKLKSYEFPEFLSSVGEADMLSNAVYKSFDGKSVMAEPERQPFDGYKCTACFNDGYYVFKEGDGYGLLNSMGTELIGAQGVKKLSAAAPDLLQIRYGDGTTSYFRTDGAGGGEIVAAGDFDGSRISFARRPSEDGGSDTFVLQLDGADIYDTAWTSAEETNIEELDTSRKCEAIYKTTAGGSSYYIAFDKFYNFTVYEAAYGFVSLKIGGEYGECYILDQKDYSELETLISSFGRESSAELPSKDENADYIQLTLGLESGAKRTLTVSPDGYCLTDDLTESGSANNKFFAVMSPETFVDLVNWVDSALQTEYE